MTGIGKKKRGKRREEEDENREKDIPGMHYRSNHGTDPSSPPTSLRRRYSYNSDFNIKNITKASNFI